MDGRYAAVHMRAGRKVIIAPPSPGPGRRRETWCSPAGGSARGRAALAVFCTLGWAPARRQRDVLDCAPTMRLVDECARARHLPFAPSAAGGEGKNQRRDNHDLIAAYCGSVPRWLCARLRPRGACELALAIWRLFSRPRRNSSTKSTTGVAVRHEGPIRMNRPWRTIYNTTWIVVIAAHLPLEVCVVGPSRGLR